MPRQHSKSCEGAVDDFTKALDSFPAAAKEAVDGFTKCLTTAGMALRHRGEAYGAANQQRQARPDRAKAGGAKALQGRRVSVPNGTLQALWER